MLTPQKQPVGKLSPDRDRLVIDYFDAFDSVYAVLRTSQSFEILALHVASDYRETLSKLANPHVAMDELAAYRQLYGELLYFLDESRFSNIRYLTIVPDGDLWSLNFDLLITEDSSLKDVRTIPFLIKKYAIQYYASSDGMIGSSLGKASGKGVLALSYDSLDNGSMDITLGQLRNEKSKLPGTRQEIAAIARQVEGDYLFGEEASERRFKELASQYQVLHMAMHGEIDTENPRMSHLSFYAGGADEEDGRLHHVELQDLELKAELAVLSACGTGSGKLIAGEGIRSIGTGFERAGVPKRRSNTKMTAVLDLAVIRPFRASVAYPLRVTSLCG